ncbi:MAG: cobalamin-binding protein [Actinobacteria bacterium]|nr:cobalamin-binding protein [Actinomycetota bacterium]
MNEALVQAMGDLEEDLLFEEVKKDIAAGRPNLDIIADLQVGLNIVGDLFAKKEYFLSELIMSAEIFKEAQELLVDDGSGDEKEYIGTFVMGTVATDIHDIGKNIVTSVMGSNGFRVIDVGIDAPIEKYIEAIKEYQPEVVGFSCLLTTAFDSMKNTITAIREAGLDEGRLLMIGGGPCDSDTLKYVGGDAYCETAQDGVTEAKKFLEAKQTA